MLIIDMLFKNKNKPYAEHKRNDDFIKINIKWKKNYGYKYS